MHTARSPTVLFVRILPSRLLRLLQLRDHLVRTVEDATRGRAACRALGCLGETLDGTRGAKVVLAAGYDRIRVRLAADETRERDVLVV